MKQLDLVITFKAPEYKGYSVVRTISSVPLEEYIVLSGICPESGGAISTIAFSLPGQCFVETGRLRIPLPPIVGTLLGVCAMVDFAPTGANIIVDVNLSGASIFTNRPEIASGTKSSGWVGVTTSSFDGNTDYLTVDVDQVGSTLAGGDLVVSVRFSE